MGAISRSAFGERRMLRELIANPFSSLTILQPTISTLRFKVFGHVANYCKLLIILLTKISLAGVYNAE